MYLVEKTFTLPLDQLDPTGGIMPRIIENLKKALVEAGHSGDGVSLETMRAVSAELTEAKRIAFKSAHDNNKNGRYVLRSVILFSDVEAYEEYKTRGLGIPANVDEGDLNVSTNDLTLDLVREEINKK